MQPFGTAETTPVAQTFPRSLPVHLPGRLQRPGTAVSRLSPVVRSLTAAVAIAEPEAHPALTGEQEELLLTHLAMVRFVARAIAERLPQHVELEELVGAGTLGLVDAVRKFTPEKNVQFRSYAQFRVRGAILDSLRSLDWSPRELRRKARLLAETTHQLEARLGRPPQDGEIAQAMNLSLRELQELTGQLRGLEIASLNAERGQEGGEEEMDLLPAGESENPLKQCLDNEARERLALAIEELPERERTVVTLYYYEELTMKEIGSVLGIVESRVSQLNHAAMGRLRKALTDLGGKNRTSEKRCGKERNLRAS